MTIFLIFIHVIISVCLVCLVLLQTGKGGLDQNFGGIATNAFGTQGANEFVRLWTKVLFVAFIVSCVVLAATVRRTDEVGGGRRGRARLAEEAQRDLQHQPATQEVPMQEGSLEDLIFEIE